MIVITGLDTSRSYNGFRLITKDNDLNGQCIAVNEKDTTDARLFPSVEEAKKNLKDNKKSKTMPRAAKTPKVNMMDMVKITCYRKTKTMRRDKAMDFYLDCMYNSDGSEHERYETIYFQLKDGAMTASDEEDFRS